MTEPEGFPRSWLSKAFETTEELIGAGSFGPGLGRFHSGVGGADLLLYVRRGAVEGTTGVRAATPAVGDVSVGADALGWWRLWALVALAHVLTNGLDVAVQARDIVNVILGLVAFGVLARPENRSLRTALLTLIVASVFVEAPRVGNHWVLAGAVSGLGLIARPWSPADVWWERFTPAARTALLVFYSFAAFAKLNTGFLDPAVSCSRFFANQLLSFWQLPEITASSAVAGPLPYLTAAIEMSVPPLLLWRRTRGFGVWLGVAFHLVVALDLVQHFFDFTLVLVALFLLFAPTGTLAELDARLPRPSLLAPQFWWAIGVAAVVAVTLVPSELAIVLGVLVTWAAWLVLFITLVRALVMRRPPASAGSLRLRPSSTMSFFVIGFLVLNGLSPYLEIKSSFGFNMYSNLVTVGGETNHLLVPGTAALRDGQVEVAIILASSDEEFAEYVDSGFALPLDNMRDYFAEHPDIGASFMVGDDRFDLARVGDHPEWIDHQHWALERFLPFRAVPLDDPPACQPSFLVAG